MTDEAYNTDISSPKTSGQTYQAFQMIQVSQVDPYLLALLAFLKVLDLQGSPQEPHQVVPLLRAHLENRFFLEFLVSQHLLLLVDLNLLWVQENLLNVYPFNFMCYPFIIQF